ncbi:hypothetical protein HBA54_05655 [Pelagibius litoralis]|uniref:Uncharacterized protein n=1 Tax=Pelagibius litoralis TaxID=374515 RepID=A0A967C1U9_9PROT|nr:hypothetical protein [Pelagibius litoralis]NIA68071.1 hypothetical protein [Pelagibius litoralis]
MSGSLDQAQALAFEKEEEAIAKDSLHILPLSGLPLITPGLKRARLIKNSHLDGVVELFTDSQSGSGQVAPEDLTKVFHFDEENKGDLPLIKNLSMLSSYDVYSLRVELRRLGIDVDNVDDLRLSDNKVQEVAPHMTSFTRPLVRAVFGKDDNKERSLKELVQLFASPDVDTAQRNLTKLAEQMNLEVAGIPKFLENYGDVYLSLAYYQSCLDESQAKLQTFLKALAELKADKNLGKERSVISACKDVEKKITTVVGEVGDTLDMFRARTEDMWDNMSDGSFQRMEQMITDYQSKVGGALCVTSVKLDAWDDRFPRAGIGGPIKRADFILNTMRRGLDRVESIDYHDKP